MLTVLLAAALPTVVLIVILREIYFIFKSWR